MIMNHGRAGFTKFIGAAIAILSITNLIAIHIILNQTTNVSASSQLKSKEAFMHKPKVLRRRNSGTTPSGPTRKLPYTGSVILEADFLYNSTTGSFWLPRPPDKLIGGYEVVQDPNPTFARREYSKSQYNKEEGFMLPTHIRILFAQGYNAGDFLACFIAPIISGRPASLRNANQGNQNSLSVVGSILHWGVRYYWGPGLLYQNKTGLSTNGRSSTQAVFATRGPRSFEDFASRAAKGTILYKIYGDAGSMLSWFYQPHNMKKINSLCVLPHAGDQDVPFVMRMNEWWSFDAPKVIDINAPLFSIADVIVQCEFVLSSSLHGIIFSDSYGVANAHMKYNSNVQGEHYKFTDYFDSIGRNYDWVDMADESLWESGKVQDFVIRHKTQYKAPKRMDLYPFWESCPMHAEAYDTTREQHIKFGKKFVREFDDLLKHRPANFTDFHAEVNRRLGASVDA
jgi:pyruvyltransferase